MRNKGWGLKIVGIIFLVGFLQTISYCQTKDDRFKVLEKRLKDLSTTEPGLNEKTDLSVSDGTLQGFLRGLASTNNLNLNIDPSLTQHVNNYFSNETVANVLLYLAHQYNLDFTFIGSIISIAPYKDPLANLPPPPKNINISYNSFTQNVSYDLQDDTLLNVAKKITQLTNRNVVVLPQLYTKRVTGYVQNLPLQNALEKLAITNSFKINTTSDSAIILEPLESDEEIVTKEKGLSNANFFIKKVNKDGSSSASSIEVNNDDNGKKIITLNVINAPIKDVIKNIAGQAGISYFEYSNIEGNTTANIKGMAFDQVLGDILHDTKYTYNIDKGVYMIGERANEGLRSVKLIQLQYRSVDSLIQFIPEDLRQGVEIKEFKELNSFLLSGSEPQIEEIASVIKQLDKVVPMITLEVIILDVNKGKSITTGISAGTSDSTVTPGGSILGGGGLNYTLGNKDINQFLSNIGVNNVFNLGRVTPSFYITLQALENRTNINERQTPKLSTLNGHTANLSIGNTEYYAISTQNVLGSLSPQTVVTQQFVPVEANLSVDITPFVSGDDQVTMNIAVSISNFTSTSTATLNAPPPTSTSKFKSIIRVKNEDMIVLGGIETTTKSETSSGVPILSRIPILKWFFSTHSKSNNKTVSIVFIKPTITYL